AAAVAMCFTALSYARMAKLFPVAGSAYSYLRHSISDHLGFIAGWAVLLDYLFLPMAIWLIGAAYLHSAFPQLPQALWVL
ncbi:Putrescine importer PuuP, partial [Streptomyces sp. CHB9.2]|nr:Putrescine importer PuuP [Streptomyces sp. CHB9.2]